ncbi:MAG: PDZ domain-containing protein [Oscillospiraceae bacterium]|nr:PDZ domain-containing protein [Oscillospiraceae bacterium]
MKHGITAALCCLLLLATPVCACARELAVGGQAVGIDLRTQGVLVAGLAEVETADGLCSPAREAGLCEGDRILRLDGRAINSATELIDAIAALRGRETELTALRGGRELKLRLQPALSSDGRWMLGMWLRDGSTGIGTLTFYDPETGVYGALGHAVCELDGSPLPPLLDGSITDAQIVDVIKGASGEPGELNGCADPGRVLGRVERNTEQGLFGPAACVLGGQAAETGEAVPGPAVIRTTLSGHEVGEYTVEIRRVYAEGGVQRLLLAVTDPELLERAGGIVQGMSGSPILQNGRLVGAVTHVLVSDPGRGYGIGIRDMLAAAGIAGEQAA